MCNESGELKTRKPKERISRHDNIANARTYLGRAMAECEGSDWHSSCYHRWIPEEKILLIAATSTNHYKKIWTEGEKEDGELAIPEPSFTSVRKLVKL